MTKRNIVMKRPSAQITERDRRLLRWIADQYTVRLDVIGHLLSERATTRQNCYQLVRRWIRMGYAEAVELQAKAPSFVWPTTLGMHAALVDYPFKRPLMTLLAHQHAVAVTRLALEREGTAHGWISERHLMSERNQPRQHIPDGIYETADGQSVAVEVELHLKSTRRLRGVLDAHASRYDAIVYVTDDRAVARSVAAAADSVGVTDRVTVTAIPALPARMKW